MTVIALAATAGVVFFRTIGPATARGVSAEAANRRLWQELQLPATASDVTYYTDSGGCEAEFAISEEPFLDWCESRGWDPQPIGSPIPYFEPVLLPDDRRPVTRGYTITPRDGRGVYDTDRGRAAIVISEFP